MKKIGELIKIADVETVIQVSEAVKLSEDQIKEKIVNSFVLTDDIVKGLSPVLGSLQQKKGNGFLLKGNYGSGKSHFIAFLHALLRYPGSMSASINNTFENQTCFETLQQKAVLPISLSLTDYSAMNSLPDIISEKISAVLEESSISSRLWNARQQINDFKKIILPSVKDDFKNFLGEKDFEACAPSEQRDIILAFLKEHDISFRPFYNFREIFDSLDEIVKEKFPGGIFLLIDELSEFLRARGRGDLVSEDIRFIQFLGETARSSNLRVLFSMQENIEEVVTISADALNRIKDRYPVRINLTVLHLKELVEKRLLIKKEGSRPVIDSLFQSLTDAFPRWKLSAIDFYAIYPVHPETIKILEGVAGIFSKTRGLVDFIITEVMGDPARNIKGMLDQDFDRLLLPDRIFDHFRNNLQESIEYNWLISVVFNSIEKEIPFIFKDARDLDLAARVMKLIMLYQVLPGAEPPSAHHLANLLIENRVKLDPQLNYTFIREKILKPLERATSFLGMEKGNDPLEDKFFFLQKENPAVLFEKKVQQFIQKTPGRDKQALWHFISSLNNEKLPLADLREAGKTITVSFENTYRECLAILKSPASFEEIEIIELRKKLTHTELDAVILLGFPAIKEDEIEKYTNIIQSAESPIEKSIIFLKPRLIRTEESEILQRAFSLSSVFEADYNQADAEYVQIQEMIAESKEKAERIIITLYSEGTLHFVNEQKIEHADIIFTGQFSKTCEIITKVQFKRTFPLHSKIFPGIDVSSRETYNQIIKLFSEKDAIDFNFEGSLFIKNALDNLFPYKGIFNKTRNFYQISPDPTQNNFIREILATIKEHPSAFEMLYRYFRKGKYGIKHDLFCLYLFILSQTGFIALEKMGKALKPATLDLKLIQSSDMIKPGNQLSPLFLEHYKLLEPFTKGLTAKKIHLQLQNKIWENIIEYKRDNEQKIIQLAAKMPNLAIYPLFRDYSLARVAKSFSITKGFIDNIRVSKNSRDGLQSLLEYLLLLSDIAVHLDIIEKFENFLNHYFDRIIFIYDYLTDPHIFMEEDAIKQEYLSLLDNTQQIEEHILNNTCAELINKFSSFQEKYIESYFQKHKLIHSSIIYSDYESIKNDIPYRILYNLSRIENISVINDMIRVDELIRGVHQSICRRPVFKELNEKPFCSCKLQKPEISSTPQLLVEMIREGVVEYILQLQNAENSKKIISFSGSMNDEHESEKKESLKQVLAINPQKIDDISLLRLINTETITLINRALSSNLRIVKRDLQDFTNAVYGRRYRKKDLLKIFENWLLESKEDDLDIIYELSNPAAAPSEIDLPRVLLGELKKCIYSEKEKLRIQCFILYYLFKNNQNINSREIINKILIVEFVEEELISLINRYKSHLEGNKEWEKLFTQNNIVDMFEIIELNSMTTKELMILFNQGRGFPSLLNKIIEIFILDEKKVSRDISDLIQDQTTVHGNALKQYSELLKWKRKFYRESGRKNEFNQNLFIAAAQCLLKIEKLRTLSLNHQIIAETIDNQFCTQYAEIRDETKSYFSRSIAAWENTNTLQTGSIIQSINTSAPLLIIMDSLRIDLFLDMLEILTTENIECNAPRLYLAPVPSDTITFRQKLFCGEELQQGLIFKHENQDWIFIAAAERDYKKEQVRALLEENAARGILLWINILDEKIHSMKQDLFNISREMEIFYREILIPMLKEINPQRKIFITADHGFIENKSYAKKEASRYSHGGNTFLERIIPCVECKRKKL